MSLVRIQPSGPNLKPIAMKIKTYDFKKKEPAVRVAKELRVMAYSDMVASADNVDSTIVEVEFLSIIICPTSHPGGLNCHFSKRQWAYDDINFENEVKLGIPWNYKGKHVFAVVPRWEDGDSVSMTSGNWEIENVFATQAEANKFVEYNTEHLKGKHSAHDNGSLEKIEIYKLPFERIL